MVYVNGVPYVSAAEYYSQALMLAQSIETVVDDRPVAKPIRLAEGPILESPLQGDAKRQTVAKPVQAESSDWLPMGTFSLLDDITQKESGKILQLATNKKGQLRGNYADESTGETKQLFGAVDPKSQRVAFRFEGDDKTVLECGLWNLTQDSVPLLIHHGDDKTEQKTLIRLSKPEGETEPELAP